MDITKILSVTGKSGLYKLISQGKNNFIVESLVDKTRIPVFSNEGVATLDNIAIFTEDEDVPLQKVFQNIFKKENGAKCTVDINNSKALKDFFSEVLPDYDKERVYISNIKKVVQWYNLLLEHQLIDLEDKEEEKNEQTDNQSTDIKEDK